MTNVPSVATGLELLNNASNNNVQDIVLATGVALTMTYDVYQAYATVAGTTSTDHSNTPFESYLRHIHTSTASILNYTVTDVTGVDAAYAILHGAEGVDTVANNDAASINQVVLSSAATSGSVLTVDYGTYVTSGNDAALQALFGDIHSNKIYGSDGVTALQVKVTNVPSVAVSVNLLESGLVSTTVINNSSGPLTLNIDSNNFINIIDSASNINNHFTEISNFFESSTNGNSNISLLGNIISSGGLLNISTNQLINSLDVVPYIANGYVVSDSNTNILSALDALNNAYLNSQLVSIKSNDFSTLNLNVSNFNLYSDSFLSILSNGYQVTDTANNITNLSELAILKAAYSLGNLKAITISNPSSSTTFTTANILNNASILSIINNGTYLI